MERISNRPTAQDRRHAFVCQIVNVDRVRVANMCPLLVTRIAIISPFMSSSTACSEARLWGGALFFHPIHSLLRRLIAGLFLRTAVSFILARLDSVVGHARALRVRVLGGREDRRRGDWPIRHGALSAIDSASAQAISLRVAAVRRVHC